MLDHAGCLFLLFLLNVSMAQDTIPQERKSGLSRMGGIGLEEVVLFLIGLGVAAALGLAIVIGPLFAIFFTTFGSMQNGNTATGGVTVPSTTATGQRSLATILGDQINKKALTHAILEGMQTLDTALRKYQNS